MLAQSNAPRAYETNKPAPCWATKSSGWIMSQLSVLIVDDCQDTTASLAFLVEAWGYAVRVANNAQEAVCLAAEHQPNVVILDVGLPYLNGWDLARQLRGLPGLRDTLLLAVSGFGGAEDQRRSL